MVEAQKWLEENYPDKKTREIYINQQLERVLDCSKYERLEKIYISSSVDSSKFEIIKGSYKDWADEYKIKETKIIPCQSAQTWLDWNYPKNGICLKKYDNGENHKDFGKIREEIEELVDVNEKGLENSLDLSDFTNLKGLYCSNNFFTQIIYPPQPEKITWLDISNNNLPPTDLTVFRQFKNLKELEIGNSNFDKDLIQANIYNRFYGSLEPLKDLDKLNFLNIENTDLNSGWEYLPNSLERFYYDTNLRPNCQLALAKEKLEQEIWKDIHEDFTLPKYKKDWLDAGFNKEQTKKFLEEGSQLEINPNEGAFINWFLNFKKLDLNWAKENEEEFKHLKDNYQHFGTCEGCQQPNTSQDWCQDCNAQHFQADFDKWTSGNEQIDNFILKCQTEATSPWNLLEWIPYEQFWNIKHIANGGFGKVEKADWAGGAIERWDNKELKWKRNYEEVALKTLSNSQNINQSFLQELTLYKMFKSEVSNMVPCYGVSRDKEGNYILVMEYMKEGNLKEYLRKNAQKLDLEKKLDFLKQITTGLKDIHRKKLVHQDFHSGNIIVDKKGLFDFECYITDLGLTKPVNETNTNQVFGVLPYLAPEVLRGQPCTQKSDIYSLGIVMYELFTGIPPFYGEDWNDEQFRWDIIEGKRPQFPNHLKYPQLLVDLIESCWNNDPIQRPTSWEVRQIIHSWFEEYDDLEITLFFQQVEETERHNKTLPQEVRYPNYQDNNIWHSKLINTKAITQRLQQAQIEILSKWGN